MTKKLSFLVALLAVSLIGLGAAQAAPVTPQTFLLAYYTDINQHNYPAAYQMWHNPPQTLANFTSGFATTDQVEPYIGALQASGVSGQLGRVPVVLLGYHTDGAIASFFGCFTLSSDFHISGATIHTISNNGVPDGASIVQYMNVNCLSLPASLPTTYVDSASPAFTMITHYFSLINGRDFADAYATWLHPIPGPKPNGQPAQDYRLPYGQYVSGYQDTTWIDLYPGAYNETGASAGHGYLDGLFPVVLVGQRSNGTIEAYYGCFVIGAFLTGQYGIVSGRLFNFLSGVPTGAQIVQYQNIDCTALGLHY